MGKATFNDSLRLAAKKMAQDARKDRYKYDPVLWAEEELGVILWSKQKEILRSIAENKRTAVKSCHSIGKTFTSAIAASWWVSTRLDSTVQSTAPTYQQVHGQLWEEIRKMHNRANLRGRVTLGDQWLVPPLVNTGRGKEVIAGEGKKPADTNIHGFHGIHRPDGVLALLDEGCGIHESIFTGAEAITTARIDRQLTTGNPDDPNTEFGRIFEQGDDDWNLLTVSAYDTPNFPRKDGTFEADELREYAKQLDKDTERVARVNELHGTLLATPHANMVEDMLSHMPDPEWVESRRRDWGEDSPRFQSKVLAQFPKTSIDSLYTGADIERGRNNIIETSPTAFRVLAVDVARYGADKTVVALNIEGDVRIVGAYNTMDTMEVAAQVHKLALDLHVDQVRVDGVGVGGGVVDRLIALCRAVDSPYVVVEMTASSSPPDRTLHRNARAYWYDTLKYQLRNSLVSIPTDKAIVDSDDEVIKDATEYARDLIKELGTIKYSYPNGVMQIESKEDIRKRGDKSPDFVDAVVMACAPINNIVSDPLSVYRPGQIVDINVLADMEMTVSLY